MESHSYDVTVIGAGPGGYVAAIRAAQEGKSVAIIEREALGGVCLNWGCIPTKALLKSAEHYEFLKKASDWGFETGEISVDWQKVISRSRGAAEKLSGGIGFLMKKNRITVHSGSARYLSPNRIEVSSAEGETIEIQTTHSIIATGARAGSIPGVEIDNERVITSREAMVLPQCPESLAIIGAGAIGVEFAYFYASFGCKVTLLEYLPAVLPASDADISRTLEKSFKRQGIDIHTDARVLSVDRDGDRVSTTFEKEGQSTTVETDAVLVAVGVLGNTENLGLEELGLELENGFVAVDGHCETSVRGVYAIGDVNGPPALAHVASFEGIHVLRHMADREIEPIDYTLVPSCVYCQPQVASVGLTEAEAKEKELDISCGKFPFAASGKAVATAETDGFVKIIADKNSGEIIGAHIIGSEATELIAELALGKSAELGVEDLHLAIHAHPTLSEAVMEAAADATGKATHI
jgi:dihydrolipoamide dehydrogenase